MAAGEFGPGEYSLGTDSRPGGPQSRLTVEAINEGPRRELASTATPIQWSFVGRTFGRLIRRAILPLWFLLFSVRMVGIYVGDGQVGCDFKIYHRALELWLSGGDPWSAWADIAGPAHYAAPPSALFPLLPFAPLDENLAVSMWVILCALCAVFIVRRLHLAVVWYVFPPLVVGVLSGNPSIPVLALLLAGMSVVAGRSEGTGRTDGTGGRAVSWIAPSIAAALKIYAVIPLVTEKRWRAIAVCVLVLGLMIVAAPGLWIDYAKRFGEISGRLTSESGGGFSATRWLPLIPPTVVALLVIARYDLRAAGWLAVPAIFPGSEWHWSTMAMVVATPWLGFLLAPNVKGLPAVAVWFYAIGVWYRSKDGASTRARLEPLVARFRDDLGSRASSGAPAPEPAPAPVGAAGAPAATTAQDSAD